MSEAECQAGLLDPQCAKHKKGIKNLALLFCGKSWGITVEKLRLQYAIMRKSLWRRFVKRKISKRTWIWIVVWLVLGVAAIVTGVVLALVNGQENGERCPKGTHKMCSVLAGGEKRCRCEEDHSTPHFEKPMIYLYPEDATSVNVRLGTPEKITTSYPEYTDGWDVTAYPCGKLIDNNTGRELYGLYWEGKDVGLEIGDSGFVVRGEDAAEFLEEKLAILGLNDREAEEFIVYWLPKLQDNEYNLVRFADKAEIDEYMPLEITPKPDTIIRILMLVKAIDTPIDIAEQDLGETPTRSDFTVVEWGGSEI